MNVDKKEIASENDEPTCLRKNDGRDAGAGTSPFSHVRKPEIRIHAIATKPKIREESQLKKATNNEKKLADGAGGEGGGVLIHV